ncbi:MAG: hypothetical protein KAH32_05930, partial [Chlamydiia bacterium]|nr:hypothetical protein [Chlamydiia bacterium]
MKLNLRKWVLGAAIALSPQLMNAQEIVIPADNADATVFDSGDIVTDYINLFVGKIGNVGVTGTANKVVSVMPFELPVVPEGKVIESAVLTMHADINGGWDVSNYDVYALAARADATVLAEDFFTGVYGTDANNTAIQAGLYSVNNPEDPNPWSADNPYPGNPPAEIVMSADAGMTLGTFLNDQYTNGATAGQFIFLRLNQDNEALADWNYSQVVGADATNESHQTLKPILTVTFKDAPKPADVVILSDVADATLYSSGEVVDGHTLLFSGALIAWGVNDAQATTASVMPFKFPEVPAGKEVESAVLTVYVNVNDISVPMDIDVYAIPTRDAATVLTSDYYEGAYGTDATATGVEQSMFATDKPMNPNPWPVVDNDPVAHSMSADGGANLAAFMNTEYDNGATSDKYFFVRFSSSVVGEAGYHSIHSLSMDHADAATKGPSLAITYKDAEAGTDPVVADIADVVASTVSST